MQVSTEPKIAVLRKDDRPSRREGNERDRQIKAMDMDDLSLAQEARSSRDATWSYVISRPQTEAENVKARGSHMIAEGPARSSQSHTCTEATVSLRAAQVVNK